MKHQPAITGPRTAFEVRREANERMSERLLGYRQAQVRAYIQEHPSPTLGELKRELDFYDKAGALRVVRGLQRRGLLD